MAGLIDLLKRWFSRERDRDARTADELRTLFKARYHQFKLLLNANSKALDLMAEMEEALLGHRSFGMTFVQSRHTGISTSVWQMIRNLNELAPGKSPPLFERFKAIQSNIQPFLEPKQRVQDGPLVIPLDEADRARLDLVGGKFATLGEIKKRLGLAVADGFAVTTRACGRFLESNDLQVEIDRRVQAAQVERRDQLYRLSADLQHLIIRSPFPGDIEEAILAQVSALKTNYGPAVKFAVRSSALWEDFPGTSHAGQYRTLLNVSADHILHAYKDVLASKYSLQAMIYRLNRGIRDEDVPMGVGFMPMVDTVSGGIAYSRNPVNSRDDRVVINATWGLAKSVVDGVATPDTFVVSRTEPMRVMKREIAVKEHKTVPHPEEGTVRLPLTEEERKSPCLKDEQAVALARLAVQLEDTFGVPQDMEWAIDRDGDVTLLQSRPLKVTEAPADPSEPADPPADAPVLLQGGVTAAPGVGSGPVFKVTKDADVLLFPAGAVLVAVQALPRWATMLDRAAAVVTEHGSVAGHLASVAREYAVPTLFGVKDPLGGLEAGDTVTVDADGRRVHAGRVEALLVTREKPRHLMAGSPVHEALRGAAEHITPLTLLDPDAPTFNAKNCRTLHDITRFCHEKSVQEVFRFGKEHHFPERSSKKLLSDIPMQWWILNLDDGFKEEVSEAFVSLDNIRSEPMLALLEGISAHPWEGPQPVNDKGFLSVMFEGKSNKSLVPGMRTRRGGRNDSMVSENYCYLMSQLGSDFSTVEALVGNRPSENYVSFQFKGGAADIARRRKRALFIAEFLEDLDFRVLVKEDHLTARLEHHDRGRMLRVLNILGYLTLHTRQLDMIMSNRVMVDHYRSKITEQIRALRGAPPRTALPTAPAPLRSPQTGFADGFRAPTGTSPCTSFMESSRPSSRCSKPTTGSSRSFPTWRRSPRGTTSSTSTIFAPASPRSRPGSGRSSRTWFSSAGRNTAY